MVGNYKTPLYRVWVKMKYKCNCPSNRDYKNFGAIGIKFFHLWDDFEVFKEWAFLNGYTPKLSFSRIDSKVDFTPENCTFLPAKKSCRTRKYTNLNEDIVRKIRDEYIPYSKTNGVRQLAAKYSISLSNCRDVVGGRRWAARQ